MKRLILTAFALCAAGALAQEPAESPRRELLGQGAAFSDVEERLLAEAGLAIHEGPDEEAPITGRLEVPTELVVRDRRGAWVQVEHEGYLGWIQPGLQSVGALEKQVEGVRERAVERAEELRRRIEEERARHVTRRTRAEQLMPSARRVPVGPFDVLTELDPADPRWRRLSRVALSLEDVFLTRIGIESPEPRPTALERRLLQEGVLQERDQIFLFSNETLYRRYLNQEGDLGDFDLGGHAQAGTAALFLQEDEAHLASFVHEAVHLLSFRLFGGRLPDWLEEGLAEDLSWSRIDADGVIEPGTFQRLQRRVLVEARNRRVEQIWFPGQLAQVCAAQRRWRHRTSFGIESIVGKTKPLREVFDLASISSLDFRAFVDPERRIESYTVAGLVARALLTHDAPPVVEAMERLRSELELRLEAQRSERVEMPLHEELLLGLADHVDQQLGELHVACSARRSPG